MSRQLRKSAAILAALGLAFTLWGTASAATAWPVDAGQGDASETRTHAAKADTLHKYKCGKWANHGGIGWRWCANITHFDDKFTTDYTDSQYNRFRNQSVTFTCSQSKSTTWEYGGSATVEAEAGVIFAKAKTSFTVHLSRSTTTTNTTSGTYKIPPRSWANCKRGTLIYSWSGYSKKQTCDSSGCVWSGLRSYTKHAPTRPAWKFGPGRG